MRNRRAVKRQEAEKRNARITGDTPTILESHDEIDQKVAKWHAGAGDGHELHEYLGWSWAEYKVYREKGAVPEATKSVLKQP